MSRHPSLIDRSLLDGKLYNMKATIDIPDDLYRRVKAKTALEGRAVCEVTIELFRNWLQEPSAASHAVAGAQQPGGWVDQLLGHAVPPDLPGPTAREILEKDRNRLERPAR
jgi:hypothetical protein